jgi:hypothetical protein
MNRKIFTISGIAITLSIITASCDHSSQYTGLAQLGSAYAAAIDKVLVAASTIKIDATSERLLADRRLAPPTIASYRGQTDVDEERLKIIERLRMRVRLMRGYLSALNDLATSASPDAAVQAAAAAEFAIQKLQGHDFQLSAGNVTSPIAKIAVHSVVRSPLRNELEARQVLIRTELVLQQKLIEQLAEIEAHDLAVLRQQLENREVIAPFIASAPISDPGQWVANRRAVLGLASVPADILAAASAVQKLRMAFEKLIEGKLTVDQVNSLLIDFNAILLIGTTLDKGTGGKS